MKDSNQLLEEYERLMAESGRATTRNCKEIPDIAERLVSKLEAYPLPADFQPGDGPYNLLLAHIRHEYTNYDELLSELPECTAPEHEADRADGIQCINECIGHDTLRWAAKEWAQAIYSEWQEKTGQIRRRVDD